MVQLFEDVLCADMEPNNSKIVFAGSSGVVKLWRREMTSRDSNFKLESLMYGHTDQICSIVLSQNFSLIVSGSYGNFFFFTHFFFFFFF